MAEPCGLFDAVDVNSYVHASSASGCSSQTVRVAAAEVVPSLLSLAVVPRGTGERCTPRSGSTEVAWS